MNSVNLIGNLTKDPELKELPSGSSVCKLRLAVNDRVKQGEEWVDYVNYFDVTVFGTQGENVAKFQGKGNRVGVSGRLRWREWESEAGKRQAVEVVADRVDFLTPKGDAAKADDDIPF